MKPRNPPQPRSTHSELIRRPGAESRPFLSADTADEAVAVTALQTHPRSIVSLESVVDANQPTRSATVIVSFSVPDSALVQGNAFSGVTDRQKQEMYETLVLFTGCALAADANSFSAINNGANVHTSFSSFISISIR